MILTSIAIFLISASALALEVVLVRVLSIGHWHHFSYLVISTALLGFGSGGTFVAVGPKALVRNCAKSLWGFSLALGVSVPFVFWICQKVPLDELQLIWDRRQIVYLLAYYLLFFIPFFCAGVCVTIAFTACAEKAHSLYFYNMAGSGAGVAAIVVMMYFCPPEQLLLMVSSVAFASAVVLALGMSRRLAAGTLACAAICLLVFSPAGPLALEIDISENKSLTFYRALPQVEHLAVRHSPLGRLDCVKAPTIRHFPGLSMTYQGKLPEQILIITDADSISAVNNFRDFEDLRCYDYVTSALAYHLTEEPDVCVIGAGGGSDVAQALALKADSVTAVEMNSQVVDLVHEQLNEFASGLYRRDDVETITAEGRSFLQRTKRLFDIINISLLDSFSASAAGLYALNESHLYTTEAIKLALGRLRPTGLLSITRMLKTPPRDSLKAFATITEALRSASVADAAEHIIMIRSWLTATIVVSQQPFSHSQIAAARRFAQRRCFDLVHLPGIEPKEVNQFHVLDEPIYYESVQKILSPDRDVFFRRYSYNIRPATDDRPYFFDFFKWKALPYMIRAVPGRWLPFSEWGYLVMAATLLQAVCASGLFILLPLVVTKPIKAVASGKSATFAYFFLLGLSYMFLEMGFIQKMTLLIGHPVFGVAVTLLSFLVFSGCGSLASERLFKMGRRNNGGYQSSVRAVQITALAVVTIGIGEIVIMRFWFGALVGLSLPARLLVGLLITAPLAFFMGIPFPTALKEVHRRSRPLVPWGCGINGFASVTAAVLGTFLAISLGFTVLSLIALTGYILAAIIVRRVVA